MRTRRKQEIILFQSTLPAWGETFHGRAFRVRCKFQSTLPAWGETAQISGVPALKNISIHSPRMGRDQLAAYDYMCHK